MIQKIYQKYGEAFVLINTIESLLELILEFQGGLIKIDPKLRNKLISRNTLERNFNLADEFIKDNALKKKIGNLIGKRAALAHKTLTTVMDVTNKRTYFAFQKGYEIIPVDENFFDDIITLAKEIIKPLSELIHKKN